MSDIEDAANEETAKLTWDDPTISVSVSDLRELLNERNQLRWQVTDLQERATAKEIEARALRQGKDPVTAQVEAFMYMAGQVTREKPCVPGDLVSRLRAELVLEEAFELVDATIGDSAASGSNYTAGCDLWQLFEQARELFRRVKIIKPDLPDIADALADIDYVVAGARLAFGIDGKPIADEVHRANMEKAKGMPDPISGKWVKPMGWVPPDVAGCLRRQGWKP